jgi:hypothetical protein
MTELLYTRLVTVCNRGNKNRVFLLAMPSMIAIASVSAIRSFEADARPSSCDRAGELGLTPSVVSHANP